MSSILAQKKARRKRRAFFEVPSVARLDKQADVGVLGHRQEVGRTHIIVYFIDELAVLEAKNVNRHLAGHH